MTTERRILTVDDSKAFRKLLTHSLTQGGYQVVEASGGREALACLGSGGFDLVITDLTMPEMDGIGLIRAMRSRPDLADTPVMFLTTENEESMVEMGRREGAAGWIVKPFHPEQLLRLIENLIGDG